MEIIYGLNPVIECLKSSRRRCHEILVVKGRKDNYLDELTHLASQLRIKIKQLTKEEFLNKVAVEKSQGVAAVCDLYPYAELEDIVRFAVKDEHKGFILILDGITDPQNLGALVRTANCIGVHGIVLPRDNSASVTAAVVKASAGATEHQMIAQVTNIARTLLYLKELGFWISGADGESQTSIFDHKFAGENVALVLGSEGEGLRRLVKKSCDHLLSIPMKGKVSSFNVSVAGAIIMSEVMRQRSQT